MRKSGSRKKGGAWAFTRDSPTRAEYAALTGEEAFLCGAEVLGFHPRTGDALAWIWPDFRIGINAVYFSREDAEDLMEFIKARVEGSE
jgi:hypothetical protein